MRAALMVVLPAVLVYLVSLVSSCRFDSFGFQIKNTFDLPKNIVDEQKPVSETVISSFKSITDNELQKASSALPHVKHLKNTFIEFKIFHHKLASLQLSPIMVFEFIRCKQKCIIENLFPNELASVIQVTYDPIENEWKETKTTTHFAQVYQGPWARGDHRMPSINQLNYTMICLQQRLVEKRLAKEAFDFFKACTELQFICLEDSVDLEVQSEIYDEIENYIVIVTLMLPLFESKHETLEAAIEEIVRIYDDDITKLAESGLNTEVPEDLSKGFIMFAASNLLLKNFSLPHHDICALARLIVFQTKLDSPTAGCYKSMKEKLGICPIMDTFMVEYSDLEDRYYDINCTTDYHSVKFKLAWIPDAPLDYKKSVIFMYSTMQFASEFIGFASESFEEDRMVESLEYSYQALVIMLAGLHTSAQNLLKPHIVEMLKSYVKTFNNFTSNQYTSINTALIVYENNFAVLRETYPALCDAVFHYIEVCRTLNYTLYAEIFNGAIVTRGSSVLYSAAAEVYHFLEYVAEPMEKQGMFSDVQFINAIILDAFLTFRCITEDGNVGENVSTFMKNYLVEVSDWRLNIERTEIMKQIPEPYKTGRRKNFSLEAILKRTKEAEEKKKIEAQKPKKEGSTKSKAVKQVSKNQASAQKPKSQKQKKRRGSSASKKKMQEVKTKVKEASFEGVQDKQTDPNNVIADLKAEEMETKDLAHSEAPESQSNGSSSEDSDSKPSKHWQNAAATLFSEKPLISEVIAVKETETIFHPTHISSITDHLGYCNVNVDPRDIAMALILIGERIWKRHFEPLQEALRRLDLGLLIQLFHYSLEKFEQEMNLLKAEENDLYTEILNDAGIKDSDHLALCLKFYKQRIYVAHPHVPRLPNLKRSTAYRHLSVLEHDDRVHPTLIENWKQKTELCELVRVLPISLENRPRLLLDSSFTEYTLAFISMHEFYPADQSLQERNCLAHKTVTDKVFSVYLDYVFLNHPDIEFLGHL